MGVETLGTLILYFNISMGSLFTMEKSNSEVKSRSSLDHYSYSGSTTSLAVRKTFSIAAVPRLVSAGARELARHQG